MIARGRLTGLVFLVVFQGWSGNLQGQESLDFNREIRPILSNKCFVCHGPDEATREAGLRLDSKEQVFGETESGLIPVTPGHLESSELIQRIQSDGEDRMPPVDAEKQLTAAEIQLLEKWIRDGAVWEEHWAFQPPRRPALPESVNSDWVQNPIDLFVLQKLRKKGWQPQPKADRETLLRRLSFDLTGLPPSDERIDEFLADDSEQALQKQIDQLLDSPHYGEHRAAYWLDAARFADTNGYQNDFKRSMWPWRDWVIRAFNDNKPFDEFVVEQIAGDLLPDPTLQQIVATGFNRNHRTNTEGGSINEEWLVENVVDRVETTSTVFLGLTMGCARCHDHKYDPISQREFYQFFAYFHNIAEKGVYNETRGNVAPLVKVPQESDRLRLMELDQQLQQLQSQRDQLLEGTTEQQKQVESQLAEMVILPAGKGRHALGVANPDQTDRPDSVAAQVTQAVESKRATRLESELGPALQIPKGPDHHLELPDGFEFDGSKGFCGSVWVKPEQYGAILSRMDGDDAYRGFDLLMMPDGRLNVHLIHHWPDNGIKITTHRKLPRNLWTHIMFSYDGSGKASGIQVYFNNSKCDYQIDADHLNGTTLTKHPLWIGARAQTPPFAGQLHGLNLYDFHVRPEASDFGFREGYSRLVKNADMPRTDAQKKQLAYLFRTNTLTGYWELDEQLEALKKQKTEVERAIPTVMVMKELPQPRKTFVLNRGQYDQPVKDQEVFAGIPAFLPQPDQDWPKNRLGLARWLVDQQNPLTARVMVNRIWQQMFGSGLVSSPENFGVQSAPPLQQELLDWLACEFMDSGWDVKQLCRLIAQSATYQQSSWASAESYQQDPDNQWLARGARHRLTAEQIRDNALAISGLLNRDIGGPSIKPYQPEGVWSDLAGGAGEGPYVQDKDSQLYRRSLYIYRKRTAPHPTMTTFDAGSREICAVSRSRTNTPLQALALLNDTTYVEAARFLAQTTIKDKRDDGQTIRYVFRRSTGRYPDNEEQQELVEALQRYRQRFRQNPDAASQLIQTGLSEADSGDDPIELAARTILASVVLNLDETVTRE